MKLRVTVGLFGLFVLVAMTACGENIGVVEINPNFPSVGNAGIEPSISSDQSSQGQVIDIAPSVENSPVAGSMEYRGALGSIADQETTRVFCVIIDGEGGNADLEVCEADSANRETSSSDLVCPDQEGASHCSSANEGTGPDYCSVSGARDYALVIINRSPSEVRVAYQVIDITGQPNRSCEDLHITEDSISADTQ